EVTYVDEKNKFEDASKKYMVVADQFSSTRPGKIAKYYAGLSFEHLGKTDEAQKWLMQAENAGDAELSALARFARAQILVKNGKGEEAVKLYQQLMVVPATSVPKPMVMLTLGDYYRKTNPAEARKLYSQIRAEFPESEVARAAQERLDLIGQS
ncbi:MAG: tetratricopeptide repeat protein, partial [Acidobacteria bacterium]|nr:tetratricopeptide repeat protein [Acidobacteriota bacterium]